MNCLQIILFILVAIILMSCVSVIDNSPSIIYDLKKDNTVGIKNLVPSEADLTNLPGKWSVKTVKVNELQKEDDVIIASLTPLRSGQFEYMHNRSGQFLIYNLFLYEFQSPEHADKYFNINTNNTSERSIIPHSMVGDKSIYWASWLRGERFYCRRGVFVVNIIVINHVQSQTLTLGKKTVQKINAALGTEQ